MKTHQLFYCLRQASCGQRTCALQHAGRMRLQARSASEFESPVSMNLLLA
jgi:hypothetical protein